MHKLLQRHLTTQWHIGHTAASMLRHRWLKLGFMWPPQSVLPKLLRLMDSDHRIVKVMNSRITDNSRTTQG